MEELRGLVVTTTGWSIEMFDEAPMYDVIKLLEYWSDNPPVHVIEAAKAGLGLKKKPKAKVKPVEKPRDPSPAELEVESKLPEHVRKVRAQQRTERLKQWEEQNVGHSNSQDRS